MLAELFNDFRYRLRALIRGADLDREMDAEIEAHLEREAEALERQGLPAAEARRQARLTFGGLEGMKERSRDERGTRRLEDYLQDAGYAWRRIRRSPALSVTIVALLALTIGSATVVFSVVNAVLLRPLPFGEPDRIALVWETRKNTAQNVVGGHEFPEWARSNRTFDALSPMIYDEGIHVTGHGEPMALLGVRVAAPFFEVMGVAPAIGRAFSPEEDTEGRGGVVILSDRLWRSRFAADADVVGRTVRVNDQPLQVVGVMPPSFAFPPGNAGATPDLWFPIADNIERYVGRHYLFVVGRVKPGVTMAQAQADLTAVATGLAVRYPNDSGGHGVNVVPLHAHLVKDVRPSLMLLLGAVGCLLLIGCSNVASLLMARGLTRRREIALELALGATRRRLVRQLVAESLLLSGAGGALGLLLASVLIDLVPALLPPGSLTVDAITLDRLVLAFAVAVSVLTGLVFGVMPAFQISHVGPADTLAQGGRWLIGGRTRVRRGLVVAQIALAVPLVLGASLMARGLVALHRVDPGFVVQSTLAVDLSLRGTSYAAPHRQRAFFDAVEERVRQTPGVLFAGSIDAVPLGGGASGIGVEIEGKPDQPGTGRERAIPRRDARLFQDARGPVHRRPRFRAVGCAPGIAAHPVVSAAADATGVRASAGHPDSRRQRVDGAALLARRSNRPSIQGPVQPVDHGRRRGCRHAHGIVADDDRSRVLSDRLAGTAVLDEPARADRGRAAGSCAGGPDGDRRCRSGATDRVGANAGGYR